VAEPYAGEFKESDSNLTQEIQFLEFMGGSNVPQAFPNYLICLRFIRICTVLAEESQAFFEHSPHTNSISLA